MYGVDNIPMSFQVFHCCLFTVYITLCVLQNVSAGAGNDKNT